MAQDPDTESLDPGVWRKRDAEMDTGCARKTAWGLQEEGRKRHTSQNRGRQPHIHMRPAAEIVSEERILCRLCPEAADVVFHPWLFQKRSLDPSEMCHGGRDREPHELMLFL